MEEEIYTAVFTDEDGNEFELEIVEYFEYNNERYAILVDPESECDCEDDDECDCGADVYIMKVITNEDEDTEEFVNPDDKDMDALIDIVNEILGECDCDCGDDCSGDCGCGCGEDK